MRKKVPQPVRLGYAIFSLYLFQGLTPACYDETSYPVVFSSKAEAEREIADNQLARFRELLDDEGGIEEFVLSVTVWPDGRVSTKDGRLFGTLD